MKHIESHFKKVDKIIHTELQKIISKEGWDNLIIKASKEGLFTSLCWSIVSQQLSKKAAEKIFSRFKKLFKKAKIEPEQLAKLNPDEIRATGISYPKIRYLQDLAKKVLDKEIELEKFYDLENETIIRELTRVKGIGKWTAEMFLIFALGREDVFSYGDLILRTRVEQLYFKANQPKPTQKEVEEISLRWHPYRSYASRILWRSNRLE